MQPWAKRIKDRLTAGKKDGLTQTGLAKACGIAQPSVNQWFNDTDSKPATEMIRGDNLIAAARYLSTTPHWIMTGKDDLSQLRRITPDIILQTINRLKSANGQVVGDVLDVESDPELFAETLILTAIDGGSNGTGKGTDVSQPVGQSGGTSSPSGAAKAGEKGKPSGRRRRKSPARSPKRPGTGNSGPTES